MSLLPPRLVAGLAWALVERKERSVARKQSSPTVESALRVELLAVQNRWKSCVHNELTGEQWDDSFNRFRGQSNLVWCGRLARIP